MRAWPRLLPALLLTGLLSAQSGVRGELDLETGLSGNAADSWDAALGHRTHWDQDLKVRLMGTGSLGSGWSFDVAYLPELRQGGGVVLARRQAERAPGLFPDADQLAALDLAHTFSDRGQVLATHRLDRLAVTYSGARFVVRMGRQALTWGGGLVFHPMDLFNPFSPNATYTAYKPGADMLYGQWLFEGGSDLQGVVVPRQDPTTRGLSQAQSSAGLRWHGSFGASSPIGLDLMLAQDHRERVLGVGLTGAWLGSTWTAEVIPTRLRGGAAKTSWLANAQYAWTWGERNVSGFAEFFHNGFGVRSEGATLESLPEPLVQHLARGELFTLTRNQAALGVELQWTPLLTLKPTVLYSLGDGSAQVVGQAVYNMSQNTTLTAGGQWRLGARGTEYGGLETAPASGTYASPSDQIYLRFTGYF